MIDDDQKYMRKPQFGRSIKPEVHLERRIIVINKYLSEKLSNLQTSYSSQEKCSKTFQVNQQIRASRCN